MSVRLFASWKFANTTEVAVKVFVGVDGRFPSALGCCNCALEVITSSFNSTKFRVPSVLDWSQLPGCVRVKLVWVNYWQACACRSGDTDVNYQSVVGRQGSCMSGTRSVSLGARCERRRRPYLTDTPLALAL